LQASRLLYAVEWAQLALAIAAIALLAGNHLLALVLMLPIGAGASYLSRRPLMPRAVVILAEEWNLVFEDRVARAVLRHEYYCTSWLQILVFDIQEDERSAAEKVNVFLLPDSASSADRRRLSTVLRWYHFPPRAS